MYDVYLDSQDLFGERVWMRLDAFGRGRAFLVREQGPRRFYNMFQIM